MAQHHQAIDIGRKQEAIAWIEAEGDGKPTRAIAHFRTKGCDDENLDEDTLNMQALDDALDDIAVVDE
ncbi:hypothetical protein JG687_00015006 [Phytophthora cactorum]|uniref:Uncharacterized protein n=1 Tax=Phytophthora cactorum TaxID=29920 RepID=A0A8T1TVL4_9STRA|nr:hypothetical protein PC113_g12831 [Phytophthora cactorum]KAG2900847.1 hypothetical protein PC114_g13427 [Phytophthora cactorum]KAG2914111.1 hypothetical protein PC115_g11784 [Phytophthora cactorum]KAG3011116.1 hypothetical protein PC119_g13318 [Phytophthora cactorum]KAG3079585.1 hypothetical protein PC122_g12173 [Phytophthora cactorum]